MTSPLRLRPLTSADLPFADSLRALAGWNQTLVDWSRFLTLQPDGCFLAEWEGAPAGTATTTVYGADLAWIGMVLVHPDYRRRGIGSSLLRRCIDYLHERGVRCIKLDATPAGKELYAQLGFKDEWTLTRWQRAAAHSRAAIGARSIRRWEKGDPRAVEEMDTAAFGISRSRLLECLAEQSHFAFVMESEPGRNAGYGLLRRGAFASYLGPVAAISVGIALELIEALLETREGQNVVWDIPDRNVEMVTSARGHGFIAKRSLTRMYLGENIAPGDPERQFAIAGPELG